MSATADSTNGKAKSASNVGSELGDDSILRTLDIEVLRKVRNQLKLYERRAIAASQNDGLRYEQRLEAKGRVVAYQAAVKAIRKVM